MWIWGAMLETIDLVFQKSQLVLYSSTVAHQAVLWCNHNTSIIVKIKSYLTNIEIKVLFQRLQKLKTCIKARDLIKIVV